MLRWRCPDIRRVAVGTRCCDRMRVRRACSRRRSMSRRLWAVRAARGDRLRMRGCMRRGGGGCARGYCINFAEYVGLPLQGTALADVFFFLPPSVAAPSLASLCFRYGKRFIRSIPNATLLLPHPFWFRRPCLNMFPLGFRETVWETGMRAIHGPPVNCTFANGSLRLTRISFLSPLLVSASVPEHVSSGHVVF